MAALDDALISFENLFRGVLQAEKRSKPKEENVCLD